LKSVAAPAAAELAVLDEKEAALARGVPHVPEGPKLMPAEVPKKRAPRAKKKIS